MLGWLMYGLLYVSFHSLRLIGLFRWTVEGLERLPPREAGGMVIVMNHVNWVDIPVVGTMLPFEYRLSWLAKAELFDQPVMGWWLRQMMVIPIKRGKRDAAALDTAVEALRNGAVLLVFPEGTRSHDGVLRSGRGGAVRLAMQAEVPIIPLAIIGTEHGAGGSFTCKPVHLTIGQPYRVVSALEDHHHPDQMELLTDEMMSRIAVLLPAERRGTYAR